LWSGDAGFGLAPEEGAEKSLAEVVRRSAFGNTDTRVAALQALSTAHPGSVASGVAALEAGRLLLADGRAAEAVAALRHPDIARCALGDYARLALGQALEAKENWEGSAAAYLEAADARERGPATCPALLGAGRVLTAGGKPKDAVDPLERAAEVCGERAPAALDLLVKAHEAANAPQAAASVLDRLDRDYPSSDEALAAAPRLKRLAARRPRLSTEEGLKRALEKAHALVRSGRPREALAVLTSLAPPKGTPAGPYHLARAKTLIALRRSRAALSALAAVPDTSGEAAEAAYLAARLNARRTGTINGYRDVAKRYARTLWAEKALLALAAHYQKDARHDMALPFYRKLLEEHPNAALAPAVAFRVGWAAYRHKSYEEAAQTLERAARRWPSSRHTPALLYWAGRAHAAAAHREQAAALFAETARRYKHSYHGMLAAADLARLPPLPRAPAPELPAVDDEASAVATPADLPEPTRTRVRQLLLVNRVEDAIDDLATVPASLAARVTTAWLEHRAGQLRPAIVTLKRAYPWYVSVAGDQLPASLWRIMYPLEHAEILTAKARERRIDAALVAGLICQESTFAADARSPAGARGLMQIMPRTGREIARQLGQRFSTRDLYDPAVSLNFGTYYLARMIERFDGHVERALAAYNAGPHRVEAWTKDEPDMPADEFIESIPFSETRHYVEVVLTNQAHYRRLYSLAPDPQTARSQP
jgi:soluble lytic murein transglycosylase